MSEYIICNGELYHFGIKGMKWGVRRFQKKDGSLTPAGKKRYSEDVERAKSALDEAKDIRKAASKAFNKAYNKYSTVPSSKNWSSVEKTQEELISAGKKYEKAKLAYKIAKKESTDGFSSNDQKSKHRLTLEEKYRNQGYSEKEAVIKAAERIRTEKIVAATAALTVTACAAYAANKYVRNRTDQLIKSGDLFQRVEMTDTGGKLHDVFYASKGDHDNKRYAGMLGMVRKQQTGHAYVMNLKAGGDVRVASKEKAAKIFGDLYKNDPDFRSSVASNVEKHFGGANKVRNINKLSDRNIRKMYENFNSGLIDIRDKGSGADTKFYNALKSAGYGAIQDINDMKFSGYNAKNPLIIFDNSKANIMVKSVKELSDVNTINARGYKEFSKAAVEGMAKKLLSPTTAVVTTGAAASMIISDYKKQHPNTKLTDKEIVDMMSKSK